MFFSNPVGALSNLRKGLTPGGSITFVCWQAIGGNRRINFAAEKLLLFQPKNLPKPDPRSPGGFAFGERAYIEKILRESGYANIRVNPLETEFNLGKSVEEIMIFNENIGPLSALLETLDDNNSARATQALRDKVEDLMDNDGLFLSAAAWLVTAMVG